MTLSLEMENEPWLVSLGPGGVPVAGDASELEFLPSFVVLQEFSNWPNPSSWVSSDICNVQSTYEHSYVHT